MNIGVIGTGNMGSMLISSFINSSAVAPPQLMITNRTISKAERLKRTYPGIQITSSIEDVINFAHIIFLCVKPHEFYPLLSKHKSNISKDQLIVSITSPITCEQLENELSCNIARAIPSITNQALSGSSLITFGKNCSEDCRKKLLQLMKSISNPVIIDDSITRISSDIASCGPAFIGFIVQCFIKSAASETNISEDKATKLASEMLIGLGKLLEKDIYTFPTLIEKVCVKGGITGEGIKILNEEIGDVFNKLIARTHEKYDEEREKIREQFKKI